MNPDTPTACTHESVVVAARTINGAAPFYCLNCDKEIH